MVLWSLRLEQVRGDLHVSWVGGRRTSFCARIFGILHFQIPSFRRLCQIQLQLQDHALLLDGIRRFALLRTRIRYHHQAR